MLVSILVKCWNSRGHYPNLRILDAGAGNGIVGAELKSQFESNISLLIGTDILVAARSAALRDRPKVYDDYILANLIDPSIEEDAAIRSYRDFDIAVVCAALGPASDDMPIEALLGSLRYVKKGGLVAVTVNEYWVKNDHPTEGAWGMFLQIVEQGENTKWEGMSMIKKERYKHRVNVQGHWIWYLGIVFEKLE
jgi:hypothetical protein